MTLEEAIDALKFDMKMAEIDPLTGESAIDTSNDAGKLYEAEKMALEILEKVCDDKMIELPCKVGDTVYCILFSPKYDKLMVAEGFVESCKIGETISARVLDCKVARYANVDVTVKISEFGKTVFLTREEAEKALKERSCK